MAPEPLVPLDLVRLNHAVFSRFSEPVFRRAETDGTPVMVVSLGEREAALPLRSLQREFGIPDESEDGQTIARIAAALDFVGSLRPGDAFPTEVLTGDASWEPGSQHLRVAHARLQLQLVAWLRSGTGGDHTALDSRSLLAAADDPALRQQVQEAFARVARELDLPTAEAVVPLVEALAKELAYVEALRDRLLLPLQGVAAKLARLAQNWRGDSAQLETLTQVRRLTGVALRGIGTRFEELDAQTGEVLATLRNLDSQRSFIRTNRDWLYRTQRAWQPLLLEWDTVGLAFDEVARVVVDHSYRFLAPRFMPVTEWISITRPDRTRQQKARERGMVW
jgi:hypothetical protein